MRPSITRIVCPIPKSAEAASPSPRAGLHAPYTRRSAAVSPRARVRARERLPPRGERICSPCGLAVGGKVVAQSRNGNGTEAAALTAIWRQSARQAAAVWPRRQHSLVGSAKGSDARPDHAKGDHVVGHRVIAGPGRRASRVLLPGRPGPAGYRGRGSLQPAGLAPPALASRVLSTPAFVVKGYGGFLRDWVPEACATLCCTHI